MAYHSSLPVLCMSNFGIEMAFFGIPGLYYFDCSSPLLVLLSWLVWLVGMVFSCTHYLWDAISCIMDFWDNFFCKYIDYSIAKVPGIIQLLECALFCYLQGIFYLCGGTSCMSDFWNRSALLKIYLLLSSCGTWNHPNFFELALLSLL